MTTPSEPTEVAVRTWKPTTAGILSIVAGVFSLIAGVVITTKGSMLGTIIGFPEMWAFGPPLMATGIVAIVGGVFALRRRVWSMALAGAICALFPPPVIALGVLSIIFLALSRREFPRS